MPGPAATLGSMHVCPLCSGTVPHIGGPVSGPGVPTVLIGGKPAAVMGDMCTCAGGPPSTIVQGEATVLIGGMPAATMGSMTSHGGSVVQGEPTVLIGTGPSAATAIAPIKKIPFPNISFISKVQASIVGKAQDMKTALQNIEQIKNEGNNNEGDPRIYNVQWIVGEERVKGAQVFKEVSIRASVLNIPDGESLTFSVKKPIITKDKSGQKSHQEEDVIEITGTVQDKMVEVTWEIEKSVETEKN